MICRDAIHRAQALFGGWEVCQGRPQGSPLLIHPALALTMTTEERLERLRGHSKGGSGVVGGGTLAVALACSSTNLYCLSLRRTWIHHWLFTVCQLHLILYAGNGRRPLNISAVTARANTAIRRTQAIQVTQMTQMTQTSLGTHQDPGKRKVTYGTDNLSSRCVHQ